MMDADDLKRMQAEFEARRAAEIEVEERSREDARIQNAAYKAFADAVYSWQDAVTLTVQMDGRGSLPSTPDAKELARLLVSYTNHLKKHGAAKFIDALSLPLPIDGVDEHWLSHERARLLVVAAITKGKQATAATITEWFSGPIEYPRSAFQKLVGWTEPAILARLVSMINGTATPPDAARADQANADDIESDLISATSIGKLVWLNRGSLTRFEKHWQPLHCKKRNEKFWRYSAIVEILRNQFPYDFPDARPKPPFRGLVRLE